MVSKCCQDGDEAISSVIDAGGKGDDLSPTLLLVLLGEIYVSCMYVYLWFKKPLARSRQMAQFKPKPSC